jgi:alpha-amylase/alpha-mannosidase (GH57 family)
MPSSKRFICIHGHFYQPPRENPWLETVETQDSAAPYHDWNERVCAECYAPNGAARIVNAKNTITRIVNNYARTSFNFGPTLLSWLKENAQRTYRMILDGERRSRRAFKGHSSAMAQVYNHIIMPLANTRDKTTQIFWGITDYISHYGLPPEGMWLAETAVDSETLELLARHGIRFTVLAPRQCRRTRPLPNSSANSSDGADGEAVWSPTPNDSVNTTRPYLVRLESGLSIAVFFYNGPVSQAIAFEGLLNSGDIFAARLKDGFSPDSASGTDGPAPQLVHVATDGETYGHHHKHGEMALAYALKLLEQDKSVQLTNYGSYLAQFPPDHECEIVENSSWSCVHGVERWRSNCGCNTGRPGWGQAWRKPLRESLDALRDALIPLTEEEGAKLFQDVWTARDSYIDVILNRSEESANHFLAVQQNHPLTPEERIRALKLMEMQRHAQLMYTSCGWFFDDISGIETVQVIAYAARALQLAQDLFGDRVSTLEPAFIAQLKEAGSNLAKAQDGANIYNNVIGPMKLSLEQVAAHYAISSMFTSYGDETAIYSYRVRRLSHDIFTSGRGRLGVGLAHVASSITGGEQCFQFAVLHFGDQNITAAVKPYALDSAVAFEAFTAEAAENVQHADFAKVIRLLDRTFDRVDYSLTSLFLDDQRRVVQLILNTTLSNIEGALTTIYEDHASLLHYLSQAGLPKPPALTLAAGFAVNAGLKRAIESDPVDQALLKSFLSLAKADQVPLETANLSYIADQRMKRAMIDLVSTSSQEALERALALARALTELPFDLNLWQAQNIWYELLRKQSQTLTSEARARWDEDFAALGQCLSIDTSAIRVQDPTATTAGD